MKALSLLALVATSSIVEGHYIFNRLIVNGKSIGGDNSYNPAFTADVVNSNDMRCNKGAKSGSTKIHTIEAGDKIGFKLFNNEFIEHPGPGFVYMSKAPESDVSSYDGSGDWFKLWESGVCKGSPGQDANWCLWQKDRIEITIPPNIPPGEYLVRVEHIGLHEAEKGEAQFYIEWTPGPLVKIPGIYKADDKGIRYNKWAANPPAYVMPGPRVWDLS
ncbi:glycosyl hydrolase family 61-domain-containing protein [Rhexocercosporidium sp. MPI-PUGE-AT-0058]|nr:glycosyl hydrolase family 61-domain-containing protein [Rhexocercosporidium sp. MPI-PUGE-AT-0058]